MLTTSPGQARPRRAEERPPFECIALLLQGGGALGSYQAGVYHALAEANLHPDWVAGISIGAINSALIAGNPPERRVDRLREFWEAVSDSPFGSAYLRSIHFSDEYRHFINQARAFGVAMFGAPHFFAPRFPHPMFLPSSPVQALSVYDTAPLRETLEPAGGFRSHQFQADALQRRRRERADRQLRRVRQREPAHWA
jgi:NTE family protein